MEDMEKYVQYWEFNKNRMEQFIIPSIRYLKCMTKCILCKAMCNLKKK